MLVAAEHPEPASGAAHLEGEGGFVGQGPTQGGAHVVVVPIDPVEPLGLVAVEVRLRLSKQVGERLCVAPTRPLRHARGRRTPAPCPTSRTGRRHLRRPSGRGGGRRGRRGRRAASRIRRTPLRSRRGSTCRRRPTARSATCEPRAPSASTLHSMAALTERMRSGWSIAPSPSTSNPSSRRARRRAGGSTPIRAAASSIASGSRSTRAQMASTIGALASSTSKS